VPYTVNTIKVTALPAHGGATVDNPAAEGQALVVGSNNIITITVRAENGTTVKAYTITVTRRSADDDPAVDARLASLVPDHGALQPLFDPDTT
jgi:VCBS repeat-containing protein